MKKDVVIAIAVGFILGGTVAILAANFPNLKRGFVKEKVNNDSLISVTPILKITPENIRLDFTSPADHYLSLTKNLDITGKTKPAELVIVENDQDVKTAEASGEGIFKVNLSLSEGTNQISATVYSENGETVTKEITVYYTSEKI